MPKQVRTIEFVNDVLDLKEKGYYQHLIIDKLKAKYRIEKIARKTIYNALKQGSINCKRVHCLDG